MQALQLLQMFPVQGSCLTTIEEAGENDCPVHLELRGLPDVMLAQDASLQAARAWLTLQIRALISLLRLTADHAADIF